MPKLKYFLVPALILAGIPILFLSTQTPAVAKTESIVLGMGCFWGAEKRMAAVPGVLDVESGYAGGDAERAGYRMS
jgi:peptide methionine sulfoxide reductase msrA/msrB